MSPTSTTRLGELKGRRVLIAPSATIWGYIRHELLFLGFALMEVALLTPIFFVILGWARYWQPSRVALWLLLVMLLPFNLIRLLGILKISLKRQRWFLLLGLAVTIFMSWRVLLYSATSALDFNWLRLFVNSLGEGGNLLWMRDLSVFLMTALCWWRGIRLAIRYPEISNVGLRMRLGGLILLPLIIWFGSSFHPINLVPFIMLFFFASLTVLSLVRAENIERDRSGTASTLDVRWFSVVAGAALLIVLLGGVVGALASGDSLFVIMAWLSPLWGALQFGATVVGITLFEAVYPLVELLAQAVQILASLLGGIFGQLSVTLRESNLFENLGITEIPTPAETNETIGSILTGKATTAIIMLSLLAIIALALARTYQKATFAARESERSQSIAARDEDGIARRVLGRFGFFQQWRAAASVRRIYRMMVKAAGAAGYPRLEAETPYEYLSSLARVWPDNLSETRSITEAYIRVRYGEAPEAEEELEAIRTAWRRLEAAQMNPRERSTNSPPTLAKRE